MSAAPSPFDAWVESHADDELHAACCCGWRGSDRDLIRDAYDDRDDHVRAEHTEAAP